MWYILAFTRIISRSLTRSLHIRWMFFLYLFLGNYKKQENTVFDYKKGWNFKNNISFEKFGGWLYNDFNLIFTCKVTLEGPTAKSTLFFSVLCIKAAKTQNTFFGYKNGSKLKKNITFEKFGGWLYNDSTLIFEVKSLWKDLLPKVHFSLAFYA